MTKTSKDFASLVNAKLGTLRDGNTYSQDKLNKLAKSIDGRAKTLDVDIHAAGVAALHVAMIHGDATGAAKVANALGRHTRSRTFAGWVERYSDIVMSIKDGVWSAKLCPKDMRRTHEELEDLAAKALGDPFWNKKEHGERDFSLHMSLASLLKRAAKVEGLTAVEQEALSTLKVLVAKLEPKADPLANAVNA